MTSGTTMPKYLIEAYVGMHECDEITAAEKINQSSPFERLDTYLAWNGILGWTNLVQGVVNYSSPGAIP